MGKNSIPEKYWHGLFEITLFGKGFLGIWEVMSGTVGLFLKKSTVSHWIYWISQNELLEDPRDPLINFLTKALDGISSDSKTFAALYLLMHGLLNLFLAIQLYRNKSWVYHIAFVILGTSMVYQIYRVYLHHSFLLSAITLYDALFIVFLWHEYKHHKRRLDKTNFMGI